MNSNQCYLLDKKCVPCEGGTPPLNSEQIAELMKEVNGWMVVEDKKIEKDFKFKNFKEAISFINRIAEIAESEGHHPDLNLHNWNKVKITLWTHAIKGLSENDFILAAKIDALLQE
jgi:4a-hydroxytetrahydrobiopterin dehydratase